MDVLMSNGVNFDEHYFFYGFIDWKFEIEKNKI